MYFSEKDKQVMGSLFKDISNDPYTVYTLKFQEGSILKAEMDTCYETDNGLDLDEEGYEEYSACAMRILDVIKDMTLEKIYKKNMLIEINYHNYPESIIDSNSKVIS